jgi:hypothetical protein
MKIESESMWKRTSDGKTFVVLGVASAPSGEYVSIKQQDDDPGTKFSPQTEGNVPKDQFLKDYVEV